MGLFYADIAGASAPRTPAGPQGRPVPTSLGLRAPGVPNTPAPPTASGPPSMHYNNPYASQMANLATPTYIAPDFSGVAGQANQYGNNVYNPLIHSQYDQLGASIAAQPADIASTVGWFNTAGNKAGSEGKAFEKYNTALQQGLARDYKNTASTLPGGGGADINALAGLNAATLGGIGSAGAQFLLGQANDARILGGFEGVQVRNRDQQNQQAIRDQIAQSVGQKAGAVAQQDLALRRMQMDLAAAHNSFNQGTFSEKAGVLGTLSSHADSVNSAQNSTALQEWQQMNNAVQQHWSDLTGAQQQHWSDALQASEFAAQRADQAQKNGLDNTGGDAMAKGGADIVTALTNGMDWNTAWKMAVNEVPPAYRATFEAQAAANYNGYMAAAAAAINAQKVKNAQNQAIYDAEQKAAAKQGK